MAVVRKVTKCGEVRYVVRIRDRHGKWFKSKSFVRKIDADVHHRTLLSQRDKGGVALPSAVRSLSLSSYIDYWRREYRGKVSLGWKITQDQLIRDFILPVVGHIRVTDIQSRDIRCVLQAMEARGLGNQQRRHVYNLLHRIFDCATSYDQIIATTPVSKRDRPEVIVTERKSLSTAQTKALLVCSRDTAWGPAIWIAALAGLRTSEIQGLIWNAIDFDKNVIHIRQAYKRKIGIMEPFPKQKKKGDSPMVPQLREMLSQLSQCQQPHNFVASKDGVEMMSHQWFTNGLRRLCIKAAVPIVSPHELRHSCTELWVEHGATEEDIIRLLNHSGAGSVRRYIHKSPERLIKIAQGMSLRLSEPLSPKLRVVK